MAYFKPEFMKINTKRIFIGIKIEPEGEFLKIVSSLKLMLANERIKWVDTENIHLTLTFLGDTEVGKIESLTKMLSKICYGFGRFSFSLQGTGVFTSYSNPRILWIGIDTKDILCELNMLIVNGLARTGFTVEDKPFRPHITLGRLKLIHDKDILRSAVERFQEEIFQTVKVTEIALFESILKQSGPEYRALRVFSLS